MVREHPTRRPGPVRPSRPRPQLPRVPINMDEQRQRQGLGRPLAYGAVAGLAAGVISILVREIWDVDTDGLAPGLLMGALVAVLVARKRSDPKDG